MLQKQKKQILKQKKKSKQHKHNKQQKHSENRNDIEMRNQQQQRETITDNEMPQLTTDSEDDEWSQFMDSENETLHYKYSSNDNSTDDESFITQAQINTMQSILNVMNDLTTDEEMPGLTSDSESEDWVYHLECNERDKNILHVTVDYNDQLIENKFNENGFKTLEDYQIMKENQLINNINYVTKENARLKQLKQFNDKLSVFDSSKASTGRTYADLLNDENVILIESDDEENGHINFITNTQVNYNGNNVTLESDVKYEITDEIEDVFEKEIIRDTNDQWIINVPIMYEDGTVVKTQLCADPGANSACVDAAWANKHFSSMICRNKGNKRMDTPGGIISPKYCMWMTFPTHNGKLLMRKMYLIDNLPVTVLADINMLKAFGYKFKDGTPPLFQHKAVNEENYGFRDDTDESIGNYYVTSWYKENKKRKMNYLNFITLKDKIYFRDNDDQPFYDEIRGNDVLLNKINIINDRSINDDEIYSVSCNKQTNDNIIFKTLESVNEDAIIDYTILKHNNVYYIDNKINNIENMINYCNKGIGYFKYTSDPINNINQNYINVIRNENKKKCPKFHRCLFLMAKQSYLATKEEIEEAKGKIENKKLEFPNYDYLKSYPEKYGPQWIGLYEAVMKWIDENRDIFAKYQFDRRTMNVPPARLGIDKDKRNISMYAAQYPINREKRLYMINYTILNEKNGFWKKIDYSLHCIPYTMIPKKKHGKIYMYRPAFDARIINQHCTLMPIIMPTIKDFRELHSIKGFVTMADFKNFFDCIPLHEDDQKYAVVHAPLGIFQMSCLTYGFMNSAPEAQKIVNPIAVFIGDCLIYIDDICIKHRFENGIDGVIDQLNRMGMKVRLINGYLNPAKFFPACDYSEGFGWQNTMIGTICSDAYRKKMLAVAKPMTKKEIQSFSGLINYMNSNIWNCKIIMFWINRLVEETDSEGKNKHVKWTKNANLSWEQIRWIIANLPLLHHPTINGKFCLQTDACNYGIGGVLWQQQIKQDTQDYQWVIIDMHSKVVPKDLRKCNIMVLEAYAIAICIEHWCFYLRGREFIISTDNMPIANIFGKQWKELTNATRKTLGNFRSRISDLDWQSFHVDGLNNPIADGLSRFTLKLIKEDQAKPVEQQQYPLVLTGTFGDDFDTPNVKSEEERKLELKIECEKLELKKDELIKNKSILLLKYLNNDYLVNNIEWLNNDNKSWNNKIMNLRNKIKNINRKELNDMIYDCDKILLRKDEYSINGKLIDNLLNNYHFIFDNLFSISNRFKNILVKLNNEIEKENVSNLVVNNVFQVVTRSKTRKAKQEKEEKIRKRNFLGDPKSNNDFENIRYTYDTRNELIEKLFGKWKDQKIIDFERFNLYQKSDNLLKLISIMLDQDEKDWNKENIKFVKKWDNILFNKLKKGKIVRKFGVLMINVYDKNLRKEDLKFIIPFQMRGDLMAFYHFNQVNFHSSSQQTIHQMRRSYWWSSMITDIKDLCNHCVLCQRLRGTQANRTPLQYRLNPPAFLHIFCDFLGPIYGKYYVLVIVDQRSGFCRLIPTDGCDAPTVIENLIKKWFTLYGYPQLFESDWGSGFNNKLVKTLTKLTKMDLQIAEPRNHRSIGKVERVIGMVQNFVAKYNIALNKRLTDTLDDINDAWRILEIIIPQIQFGLNQRISRISNLSPNQIAFGRLFNDPTIDIKMRLKLKELRDNKEIDMIDTDYEYLYSLTRLIDNINSNFLDDWKNYCYLSRKNYNNKYRITIDKINKYKEKFDVGSEILYFVGDKQVAMKKWKEKWTGPWIVEKHLNDTSLIITDPDTGDQRRTNFNRIKLFHSNKNKFIRYNKYYNKNKEFQEFQKKMLDEMRNNKGVAVDPDLILDYNQ